MQTLQKIYLLNYATQAKSDYIFFYQELNTALIGIMSWGLESSQILEKNREQKNAKNVACTH